MLDLRHLLLQKDSDGQTILHLAAIVGQKDPPLLATLLDYNMSRGFCYISGMVNHEACQNPYHGPLREIFGDVEKQASCHIMMWLDKKDRTASNICGLMKFAYGVSVLDQY